MYWKYGMLTASLWNIWGPKTWWVYLREMMKGAKLITSEGDISQRGGDVLIDPAESFPCITSEPALRIVPRSRDYYKGSIGDDIV